MNDLKFADLHTHTTCSDGTDTPAELVRRAAEMGYAAVAITDHDTCSGLPEGEEAAAALGVELIPGIEVSTYIGEKSVHILGYMMDVEAESFKEILELNAGGRMERMRRMVDKLNGLGYRVELDDLLEYIGGGTVGRALLAKYLVHRGHFGSVEEVFAKILGDGKPVYEPVPKLSPEKAIRLIAQSGGVSSLAHPGHTMVDDEIPAMARAGLDGIETFSPQHDARQERRYVELARRHGLLVTGGSDSHGGGDGWRDLGSVKLPYENVERLKERAARAAALNG
ncbi:MAG: PHP domain-containing protein [Candidatus Nitrospinota bacterium M3_3B_026]